MIRVEQNKSLQPYNTFGIDVKAENFVEIHSIDELNELKANADLWNLPKLFVGGGSNMLLTQDQKGLIILNSLKGIQIEDESENNVVVSAYGGEVWHEFVMETISNDWGGLENLSLIPGSVGASPMQNIGAYGEEIKDRFEWLDAYHLETGEIKRFTTEECAFGYRESVFKRALKDQYFIFKVAFRLDKKDYHHLNTSYGAIQSELESKGITEPTIREVSNAVIAIRQSKLPDPKKIGNSGSFFKNPVISIELFEKLKQEYPNISSYPVNDKEVKVAAGWLIDNAGWKGKTIGNYGVHKNQALVLVNYGGATGKEIYDLSTEIIDSIKNKYGIELEREVNIL